MELPATVFNVESPIYSIVPDMPVLFVLFVRTCKVLIHFQEGVISRPPRVLREFEEPAFGRRSAVQLPFIDKLFLERVVSDVKNKSIARVEACVLTTAMN